MLRSSQHLLELVLFLSVFRIRKKKENGDEKYTDGLYRKSVHLVASMKKGIHLSQYCLCFSGTIEGYSQVKKLGLC